MRVSRLGALVVAAVLLVNSSPLVEAQLGIETQNASGDSCECSPACEGDVGGALGGGGCRGRVVVREDCPCCKVCSQQKGTKCSHPSRPCDTQFGLICSVEGICEAEYSCQTDSECPDDRFCLGEVCVDPCPILTPCQGALKGGECVSTGHRPGCQCPEGTIANSAGDVCVSNNGTTEGCEHDGRLYAKGETRYTGKCQEQCQCGADGQFSCGPVSCPAGLFLAGQHSKEELCIELRNRPETDECCVVVVCANSLTRPSLLSSPADMPPSDPITEEEATSAGQTIRALSGRNVGLERIEPITEEEYQKRLKDLELELNKGLSEKKPIDAKQGTSPQGMNATGNTEETAGTENQEMVTEEAPAAITEMTMVDESMQDNGDMEEITTMMPEMQQDDQMMLMEGDEPAVVVEYSDDGEEVHRITVQEQVEVVTSPSGELEMTTVATGLAEEDMMPTDAVPEGEEEMSTEAAPVEVDEGDGATREGKMTQEEEATANESAITFQEKVESKLPAGGLKVLAISHNSSTLVLPSTKGGDIYYKAFKGSQDWQRVSVEAGQDSLVLKGLQPNTQYTLKWSGESGGSAKITIDTQEGCKHKNVSYGVSQEWSDGCQHRCSCRPGGIPNCQPRCLFVAGDIKDPLCTERPSPEDPECCVVYDCKKTDEITVSTILNEEQAPGQPKLLVTEKTHNSVTIAWDDFRPRTYEGGYVVEYREGDEPSVAVPNEEAWMMKELPTGPHQPKLTVENLKPSTVYQVRVSIYDETDHTGLGESTETLTVRTEPGCMYNNESYMVGESFIGCEERCVCYVNGDIKCFERCSLPYFRAGSFKDDPLCRELPKEGDDCCVIVQCATSNASVRQGINATSFTEVSYNQCTNVVCGANAECVSRPVAADNLNPGDSEVTLGYCRCLKGFVGDAADLRFGCVASPSPDQMEGGCTYKNSTYRSGETFYDGCDYRCSCNDNSEIECEPRCEFPHANGTKTEPGCEYIPDPEDTCCKLRVCNSTSEAATDAARAPSLISDGCTEGNVTYAKNEKFYKGCQTQCTCIGFGDVECVPRCPPLKVMSDTPKRCETLPDPLDACCLITVCDQETPDVMKANITEMEKEMMMMKERMKNMTQMEKDMLMKRMSELEKEMMMKNISAMEMTLQKMIEEQDKLMMNTNISEMEKEMIRNNMTEIEMMMRAVAEMEKEITTTNMTDIDRAILKLKLMEMQNKLTEEMSTDENGVMDEHALSHVLGLEQSHAQHMDDMKNHTHTHEDGITHTHPGGHLPHSHDDMENITHTHEDGTTHTHPAGHIPHSHDDMNDMDAAHSHTHAHDDNATHSHPHDHMDDSHNHTHDLNVEHGHEHTHEDGTTHIHPHEHMDESHNHTHDDMDENHNNTHMHENGTIHSHPHEHVDESHNHTHDMDNHTHTHEDGTTHSHPHFNMDDSHNHTHEMGENHTHTHEDGMTHEHMDDSLNHTHEMDDHTHEDGTTHSHPHEHMDESHNHTHDMDEILNTHMHENGTVHSHPHENMDDHNHEHMDDSHNHTHEMDDSHDHVHIHADGTTHSHPHEHMNDSHVHEHDMQEGKNDTHVHENGMIHSHPVVDEFHNHTLFNTLEKKNRAEDLGTHDLNILDVMPVNTTAVKVTVGVSENVMSQILSSEDQYVKVFYSPDSLTWMEKNVSVRDIQVMNMEEIVFFINDLQPSTSYQFRISYHDFVSTTSKARLLSGTMDTGVVTDEPSFRADCIVGTRFVEEKKCGRHCTCIEDGYVKCEARCPVVSLPENFKGNCSLVPNPEDPCCTVPDCLLATFVQHGNGAFDNIRNSYSNIEYTTNRSQGTNEVEENGQHSQSRIENNGVVPPIITTVAAGSLDSINNQQRNTSHFEHPEYYNTLIPQNRGPSSVSEESTNSSQKPISFPRQHDQSKNTATTILETNEGNAAEGHEQFIANEEENLAYLPNKESQNLPDVNFSENQNFVIHEFETQAAPQNTSFSASSTTGISSLFGIASSTSSYLPNEDVENEVGPFSDHEKHDQSFPGIGLNRTFTGGVTGPSTIESYPATGSEEHLNGLRNSTETPYLLEGGKENLYQQKQSDQNRYLLNDRNIHSGISNEHEVSYLPTHSSISNEHEVSYLPTHSGISNEHEVSYLPTHSSISNEHEVSYLPSNSEDPSYLPSNDEGPSYFPSNDGIPSYPLSNTEESSYLPSNDEKPSYLPTSVKPPIHDEGQLFSSLIPPSSHNEADVSSHSKDGMDMGIDIDTSVMCSRDGRYYKPGEEFYQGCSHSCICSSSLEIHCAAIECPVTFGLELIDPNCIEWDVDTDYVPTPPKCCPQVKCIESAACHYMGQIFNNYDTIPRELTGCSKVCTCNYGNVTCRDLCDPIPSIPPADLNCAPEDAVRITLPGETCCETWQCSAHSVGGTPVVFPLPPDSVLGGNPTSGFIPITPNFNEVDGIAKPHITSVDPNTARLSFSIPAHYQGLPGELLVRYTKMPIAQPDPMTWTQDVLVQSGNTINHSKWDYSIGNLDPATQYTMQLVLTVLGANSVTSPVFSYTTMDEAITSPPTTTPLPRLEIDAELYASEITKTSAKVSWRHFDDYELQYIDGVQVKYTEKDKLIPKFSQLFHRDNNQMDLRGLQPGNNYTVDLVFMTHKNQTTQVSNTDPITFTTLPEEDPYAFDITVVAGKVSSQSAELTYSGVPEPEEKYVNVYRAVYLREVERIDAQSFKIPKIGQEKKIFLNDLKPDVEYQVWLEAYLSNGRNKKSNVITIKTRAGQLPTPERSEVDPSVPTDKEGDGYYPALVAVAIIAAIACIGFLGLLIILLRKQNHAKAHINSSRNNAAYDNPSYKVGDNGYDMEMNGIKGSGNGATHMEEP